MNLSFLHRYVAGWLSRTVELVKRVRNETRILNEQGDYDFEEGRMMNNREKAIKKVRTRKRNKN